MSPSSLELNFGLWIQTLDLDLDCDKSENKERPLPSNNLISSVVHVSLFCDDCGRSNDFALCAF